MARVKPILASSRFIAITCVIPSRYKPSVINTFTHDRHACVQSVGYTWINDKEQVILLILVDLCGRHNSLEK